MPDSIARPGIGSESVEPFAHKAVSGFGWRLMPLRRRETMTNNQTPRGRAQDRAKVAGGQEHEVKYEARKTGAWTQEVKDAVKSEGNSRRKVEDKLNP